MRLRALGTALAAAALAAACKGAIAPAPPPEAPDTQLTARVAGDRRVVAPKAARRLQDAGFTTRRFSTDSMWTWRGQEKISGRLRFSGGTGSDSTRVLIELWGPCPAGVRRPCLQREAAALLASFATDDPVPQ